MTRALVTRSGDDHGLAVCRYGKDATSTSSDEACRPIVALELLDERLDQARSETVP